MALKRVVVTGLGALTPIGKNVPEFWEALANGVSGSNLITRFDTEKFKTHFACEIKNYDPKDHFDRKELRKLDLFCQFALISADEAIRDANIETDKVDHNRIGVIYGSGIGGLQTFYEEIRSFVQGDGTPRFSPFFIPKIISDIAAGHISIKYGFRGPNFATVSACSTAANAIIDAYNYIRLDKADIFVTGGAEAPVNRVGVGGFNAIMAISTNNDEYKTASRPFDKTRDGFVMGEGAGTLVLEELEHARARGAKIYAELAGAGLSADAYHITAPHPEGLGAALVMEGALKDANMTPRDIDYINVHGTATPLGDLSEIQAIEKLFGEHAYEISISSTKSMTGHLLGAAGAAEAIASIMAIQKGIIPPTINHFVDDPAFNPKLDLTFNKAKKKKVNVALSNTFGFGGHNASIIFKKFES